MSALVLDSIIFGLQRFGGISNFWTRLIDAVVPQKEPMIDVLMPRTVRAASVPDLSPFDVHVERIPTAISRYLPARVAGGAAVFHTSYYRRPSRTVDRYVVSVYDFTYERYFSGLPRHVHHHQKRASILAADLSLCISSATRDDLLNTFPQVVPERTRVVPLGVDRSRFYPDPDHGAAGTRPYVLFVGQRGGYKRFDLAVAAVARAAPLMLSIVGPPLTGEEKAGLENVLPGRWVEKGGVGGDALRRLYSNAYAFLFPSDYEGFGLPILEAMACNCPVIAADRSSFPEVAGEAALLAQDQSADTYAVLLRQLEDGEHRRRLIAAGADRVALFDWDSTFRKVWHCYGAENGGGAA